MRTAPSLEWDLVDRLQKSLRYGDVGVSEMADYLGVTRGSVSKYLHDRTMPDTRTLRLWAIRTGVPYEWLKDGKAPAASDEGRGVAGAGFEPATSGLCAVAAVGRRGRCIRRLGRPAHALTPIRHAANVPRGQRSRLVPMGMAPIYKCAPTRDIPHTRSINRNWHEDLNLRPPGLKRQSLCEHDYPCGCDLDQSDLELAA